MLRSTTLSTDCSALTELTLPSGLASIGDQAFKRIGGVVYLSCNLPDTDNGIFRESGITKLVIAEGVTTLGKRSFSNSSQLSSISFPSTLTAIGEYAFFECRNLTSITLPSSLRSILRSAFERCSALTELAVPDGVESIADYAFCGCTGLQSVRLPSSIRTLGREILIDVTGKLYVNCRIPDTDYFTYAPFYNSKAAKPSATAPP